MRQFGEGGKELAVGAGAEAVGAAGAVDAAWAEVAVAGAGAGSGVGVEEAGVEAEQELILDPVESLSWACSDGPLGGEGGSGFISFQNISTIFCYVTD